MLEKIQGVIPAVVTPFTGTDELDQMALRKIVEYLVENGVHGIMTTGGTGEFVHLSEDEKKKTIRTVVDEVNGKVPVIAGTSACSTREAIMLSKYAEDAGADGVIATPPFYFRLPRESIIGHYKSIAQSIAIALVAYNNPIYTGNPMDPALIAELTGIENMVGLKQSESDIGQFIELVRLTGDRLSLLTGIDSQFYPSLCVGGKGVFSTAACIAPKQMVELYSNFERGNLTKAFEIHRNLQDLNRFLEYDPGYVAPCKEAMMMLGLPAGNVRQPLPSLTSRERGELRKALICLGLLK